MSDLQTREELTRMYSESRLDPRGEILRLVAADEGKYTQRELRGKIALSCSIKRREAYDVIARMIERGELRIAMGRRSVTNRLRVFLGDGSGRICLPDRAPSAAPGYSA